MSQTQTVTINGRKYDARTGLPVSDGVSPHTTRQQLRAVAAPKKQPDSKKSAQAAQLIHSKAQRSKTLNRKFTKKPHTTSKTAATTIQPAISRPSNRRLDGVKAPAHTTTLHKSTLTPKTSPRVVTPIRKPTQQGHTVNRVAAQSTEKTDTPHIPHPAVTRAHQQQSLKKTEAKKQLPPASVVKQAVIQEALDNAPKHHAKQHKHGLSTKQRISGLVCGCAALVLFAGYLTYLNVPNISVRVAAAQAGINASYPGYHPDGYRLNGPVAYSNGQVRMQFAANTGASGFTINQSRSNWDSSALLENYVKQKSSDEYSTSQEKGLTIYNYGSNAAWVSGGILYTIEGDAPLSPDQIRKIATSV